MEEFPDPWVMHERLRTMSIDGPYTPLSSKSCNWGHSAIQSLVSRQQRAFKLLVQHEGSDWARLIWRSDIELTRFAYNTMLQLQLTCGHLAEDIEAEEKAERNALKQLFETEQLECLRSVAKRRCSLKVCGMWENEWSAITSWSKARLERSPFTDSTGKMALDLSVFDSLIAQENLCWSSEAREMATSSSVDVDGARDRQCPVIAAAYLAGEGHMQVDSSCPRLP
eukprot:GGOE01026398.1.p2 GENE.GGOE01026398.1~~GGOE01026398.1.p2  ORF type:complete len:256 (-),score=35.01 GGOE01026398.1:1516-2190(-)